LGAAVFAQHDVGAEVAEPVAASAVDLAGAGSHFARLRVDRVGASSGAVWPLAHGHAVALHVWAEPTSASLGSAPPVTSLSRNGDTNASNTMPGIAATTAKKKRNVKPACSAIHPA